MTKLTVSEAEIKRYIDFIDMRAEWHRRYGCLEGQSFIHIVGGLKGSKICQTYESG